ncbi:ABC transporter permease subunit [Anaerosporobacter sp.]|uniref:ABC transporter permease subunit n=1 Tax=Anaerosporobacter sp. TaxID=1872529 RepID=UPI00286F4E05|nr:ABC transporter permease subunit [Anaerosporobacter sp.]
MINILRADFYKLFHTKVFYVCTFILVCFVGIMATAYSYVDNMPADKRAAFEEKAATNSGTGVSLTMSDSVDLSKTYLQSGTRLASDVVQEGSIVIFIIAIMITIMVGGEFKERTIKSMVAKGYRREHIVLSKMIVSLVSVIVMMVCVFASAIVIGGALTGVINDSTSAELTNQVRCCLGIVTGYLAFTALYTLLVFVIRNIEISLIVNILVIVILPNILSTIESTWKIPFSKIQITTGVQKIIYSDASTSALTHMGILFLGYVIVSTILSCVIFRKADVK